MIDEAYIVKCIQSMGRQFDNTINVRNPLGELFSKMILAENTPDRVANTSAKTFNIRKFEKTLYEHRINTSHFIYKIEHHRSSNTATLMIIQKENSREEIEFPRHIGIPVADTERFNVQAKDPVQLALNILDFVNAYDTSFRRLNNVYKRQLALLETFRIPQENLVVGRLKELGVDKGIYIPQRSEVEINVFLGFGDALCIRVPVLYDMKKTRKLVDDTIKEWRTFAAMKYISNPRLQKGVRSLVNHLDCLKAEAEAKKAV